MSPARYLLFGTERYALPILRPLQQAIRARGADCAWWLPDAMAPSLTGTEQRLVGARAVRAYDPTVVLCASNEVPPFFPGLKVQLFHGFSVDKRSTQRGHFRIRGLFDLYCTQGPSTTAPFQALAAEHRHFRVVETGWPKLDPLFGDDDGAAPALRPADGRPVIGLGSTFTARLAAAPHLYEEVARLAQSGPWHWLVTLHPKSAPELIARYRGLQGPHLRFVETEDVLSLLRAADVLVADTSSIVSEFAVQIKPVVTFRNAAPKPHMLDIQEPAQLAPAIAHALARPPQLMQALAAFAAATHPYRDGRSSVRVLEACGEFIANGRAGLARKPLNLWRRLQLRRRYGWRG
jgi:CDP-glycerol glycerophosphotransferase (TagB/SpsB family)